MCLRLVMLSVVLSYCCGSLAGAPGGDFERWQESRPDGWEALWVRERGAGELAWDLAVRHAGERAARVTNRGEKDWSLNATGNVEAKAGDIFEVRAWLKVDGSGSVNPCVAAIDGGGKTVDWSLGDAEVRGPSDWVVAESRFVVPTGVVRLRPRVVGTGQGTIWIDDFELRRAGNVGEMRVPGLADSVSISNVMLRVAFDTVVGTMSVEDRRTGKVVRQAGGPPIVVKSAEVQGASALRIAAFDPVGGLDLEVSVEMDPGKAEFVVVIVAKGEMRRPLAFPGPFVTGAGSYLVVPMNEGISYPVDDGSIAPMRLIAYGGHGICMGFWGVTDGAAGHMAIIETPDDAAIRIDRSGGMLCVAPEWEPQKGAFGYARKLRYVFFDGGGHVAMCGRYRDHAKAKGLVKTLRQKRDEIPAVDLLIGAVNVWCWEKDAVSIARELKAAGIERILWSNRGTPESIGAMNAMGGILTGRYDIYQDLMDPDLIARGIIRGTHSDWTQGGWPRDIILDARGKWIPGWGVKGKDGATHPCGVLCDSRALDYAMARVPADLAEHPYRARFIDTTTASPWRECYSPEHPMTRGQSREWKMRLLEYMSKEMKLVTGCETGHDASVPFLHYFEGMLSLGPYRVPDSGRDTRRIWDEVPERVAKFQLGHRYRLPLWELVYHDCTVAQWYWGDYNNKLPSLWDKRDLFNALYGTPPMFMFDRKLWEQQRDRFARSYRATCPVARAVGFSEMTDHRFLTPDRDVQQTRFDNGVTVTVNFGEGAREVEGLGTLAPMSARADGI